MIAFLAPLIALLAQVQPLVIQDEKLTYDVRSARVGKMGRATFSVTQQPGGNIRLAFDFDARVLFFKVSDHTFSELEPESLRMVRYRKRERSPLGGRDEDVAVDYAASTWTDHGKTSPLACDAALDELSMIYLIRNTRLAPGEELTVTRHFDAARNPIRLRGVADAEWDLVEMSVPDPRQDNGTSTLRFYLSRDERRVPVRIESSMPGAGRVTMVLVKE